MPRRLFDEYQNWINGVNTSASADELPDGFSPRGRNTTIKLIGEGTARLAKRRGALTLNATPVTGSPATVGFQFRQKSGVKTTLLVSDNGRLDKLNADGTTTVINASGFTAGTHYPTFTVANDLCFIVNDVDQKKYDGTNLTKFGITRPAAPTAANVVGGANGMTGVYDIALSYYNALTGHESSRSDFTTVTCAANDKINVSWAAPSDAQVTHVRVHIRKQALGPNVFRLVAGATPAPDATTGGFAVTTLATVVDVADTTINAFILFSPTIAENNPPPAGAQFPVWHNSRLFLADSGNLFYSSVKNNTPFPEAFDPNATQPVNPNDGDVIVGLYSMWGRLFIFKRFSLWELTGSDPNSWNLALVSADHGASSQRSICSADGVMFWWSAEKGPVAYDGSGLPTNIGKQLVEGTIAADQVNQISLGSVCAGVDESNQTVMWAYPQFGSTRNTRILPFNYRAKKFNAEFWNPFDVYSMWVMETSDHLKALYMGNYAGQAFQWWAAGNDGVPAGTTKGKVSSSTSTTLTDSAAAFSTVGAGLKERYAYVISADRQTIQRRRITANTATQITVTPAWDTAPNVTYTYAIGAPQFEADTPWTLSGDIFLKKRYEFLFTELTSTDTGVIVDVDLFASMDEDAPRKTVHLTLGSAGGVYDATSSIFDVTKFGSTALTLNKTRMAFTGKAWRARVRNCQPDEDITICRIAAQSVPMAVHN